MEVIDLYPQYRDVIIGAMRMDEYLNSHTEFFDHYRTFWATKWPMDLIHSQKELDPSHALLRKFISLSEKTFRLHALPCESISALFFAGPGDANGHAFYNKGIYTAWFDLTAFKTELSAKVFAMHELVHALHYSLSPEFYFSTIDEKNLVWRQLITEGIATYLTKRLWNMSSENALWADYLSEFELKEWMEQCRSQGGVLREYILKNWNVSNTHLFSAADPNDIFSFRAGYFIGLSIIEKIAHNFSPLELLTASRTTIEPLVLNVLRSD